MNRKEVETKWREEGFSCQTWIDPPGQLWLDRMHPEERKVWVIDGSLQLVVGEQTQILQPGDECTIPARSHYTIRVLGPKMTRWLYGSRLPQ